jgi:outer membrane protein insertion porin family
MSPKRIQLAMVLLVCLLLWRPFQTLAAIRPGAIVRDIAIQGNRRTQTSTIRFYLKTKIGSPFSPRVLRDDIKRLYALRTFDDIRVTAEELGDGIRIVITVTEKPAVRHVTLEGRRRGDKDEVRQRVRLKERATFERNLLNDSVTGIQDYYRQEGYYFAHVRPEVVAVDDNQVDVTLHITEGKKVRIRRIQFTGNTQFPDSVLQREIQTKPYQLPILSGSASLYRPEGLRVDLQLLQSFYQNNGFINIQLGEPTVEINREASSVVTTIPIVSEGEQYKVGAVGLTGDNIFEEAELRRMVQLRTGEIYSREVVRRDILALTNAYTDQGYAFADATPTVALDKQQRLVNVSYTVRPGSRVYIGRIDIRGNERTRDWVIRRELRVDEGELYSGQKLRRSRQRLTNLDYFDEVKIDTLRHPEQGLIDLEVDVTEKSTGQFSAGLGFSSVETVVFQASVTQRNLFGRGQSITAQGRIGGLSQDFSISFVEPWLFGRPINAGVSLFRRSVNFQTFDSRRTGVAVTLGRVFGEFLSTSVTYRFEELNISDLQPGAADLLQEQEGTSHTSSMTPRVVWDSRNSRLNPSQGSLSSFEVEVAGLGGDNRFYKLVGESTWYYPLPYGLNGFVKGRFGVGAGYGGEGLPASERFFLGGPTTVRGFGFRDIGPQDLDGNPLGGTSFVQFNLEVGRSFSRILRLVAFMDVGNVYSQDQRFDLGEMRRSVGFGIRFITPVGPVRMDWGFKLDRRPGERLIELGFLLGAF